MGEQMAAVSDGELSPELVLVCPELRDRVLAEMPDPEWVATIAQVRARTKVASRPLLQRRQRPRGRRAGISPRERHVDNQADSGELRNRSRGSRVAPVSND